MKTEVLTFWGVDAKLTRNQLHNFMEKKIKKTDKDTKSKSYNSEEKIIIITIIIALLIISALLVRLTIYRPIEKELFSAIYYLDSEKKTENFPKTVVLGENSTFSLWLGVQNWNDTTLDYQVQVKLDDGDFLVNPSPAKIIESYEILQLENEKTWEEKVVINIEELGKNRVLFELYVRNGTSLKYDYTGNWVSLTMEAISLNWK